MDLKAADPHRLMSAFFHDPIVQPSTLLLAVFLKQFLLIDTRESAFKALLLFKAPAASPDSGCSDLEPVSDD